MNLGILDFFKDITNFVRSGSVLGIDIGTSSVKIVEISKRGERMELENYGILETKNYLEHPNQAIQTSSLKLVEKETIELLKILIREGRFKSRIAVVALPAFSVFVTPLDMPFLTPEETAKSINFQAKQYIPLPLSEVSIDWMKIDEFQGSRGEKNQRILLIGVPHEIIQKYKNVCRAVGLKIIAFELESLSLLRTFLGVDDVLSLIVDIGAQSTNILVSEKGVLRYNSQTDYGGIYLTQALSRSLGVSAMRAEELKKRRGLLGSGGELELSTLMVPFLDVIIQECQHVADVFERRYGRKIEKAVLTGGGANLLGIAKYFTSRTNLTLINVPSLGGLSYSQDLEPAVRGLNNELLVAIGLGQRYFG